MHEDLCTGLLSKLFSFWNQLIQASPPSPSSSSSRSKEKSSGDRKSHSVRLHGKRERSADRKSRNNSPSSSSPSREASSISKYRRSLSGKSKFQARRSDSPMSPPPRSQELPLRQVQRRRKTDSVQSKAYVPPPVKSSAKDITDIEDDDTLLRCTRMFGPKRALDASKQATRTFRSQVGVR